MHSLSYVLHLIVDSWGGSANVCCVFVLFCDVFILIQYAARCARITRNDMPVDQNYVCSLSLPVVVPLAVLIAEEQNCLVKRTVGCFISSRHCCSENSKDIQTT